jgi:hypothetical protein
MVYSSIAYGLLRDGAVCSGLPGEPAPNTPCAAFLMSAKGEKKREKREKRSGNIYRKKETKKRLGNILKNDRIPAERA